MFERFNKGTRIIIAVALAVVIWITGILIGQEQTILMLQPSNDFNSLITRTAPIKVSLMIDFGDGRVEVYPEVVIKYSQSVVKLLEAVDNLQPNQLQIKYQLEEETGEISNLSIKGYPSTAYGKQWLVWLNNNLKEENFSKILLKSGDLVELKYIKLRE